MLLTNALSSFEKIGDFNNAPVLLKDNKIVYLGSSSLHCWETIDLNLPQTAVTSADLIRIAKLKPDTLKAVGNHIVASNSYATVAVPTVDSSDYQDWDEIVLKPKLTDSLSVSIDANTLARTIIDIEPFLPDSKAVTLISSESGMRFAHKGRYTFKVGITDQSFSTVSWEGLFVYADLLRWANGVKDTNDTAVLSSQHNEKFVAPLTIKTQNSSLISVFAQLLAEPIL